MLWYAILVSLLSSSPAPTMVGALPQARTDLPDVETSDPPLLVKVDRQHRRACRQTGAVCPFPGGGSTVYIAGFYGEKSAPVTGLTRASRVAGRKMVASTARQDPWQVDVVARLKERVSGPVVVAIFDAADQEGIGRREARLVWDLQVPASRWLGLKTMLDATTFTPGHTYLIRFAQLDGKTERILAEGELRLE